MPYLEVFLELYWWVNYLYLCFLYVAMDYPLGLAHVVHILLLPKGTNNSLSHELKISFILFHLHIGFS